MLRKAVKNWDDDITRPLITRFYDWNMQFNEKPEIKGDFSIEARGSGALLVREKQQENLMIYSNLSMSIPEFNKRRDWAELDREIAKSLELPYDQITLGDEEMAEMEALQMEMASTQVDPAQQKIQLEAQIQQIDMQLKQQRLQLDAQKAAMDADMDRAELAQESALEQAKLGQLERLEIMKLEAQERLKLAELQLKYRMSNEQVQNRTAVDIEKIRTDRDKTAANTNVKLTEAQLRAQNLNLGYDSYG